MKVRAVIAILVIALVSLSASAKGPDYLNKVVMHSVGDVTMNPATPEIVSLAPLQLPPDLIPLLTDKVIKIQVATDVYKGKATVGVWLVPGNNFPPDGFVPPELMPFKAGIPISLFIIQLQDVVVGDTRQDLEGTVAFIGKVIQNPVPSPFGPIEGRAAAISTQFNKTGDDVTFTFTGGFVAGSHSTWNFTGKGSLFLPE